MTRSLVDFVADAAMPLIDRRVTNAARLLASMGGLGGELDGEASTAFDQPIDLDQDEDAFATDPIVVGALDRVGVTLWTEARARNELRRRRAGIIREVDVRIPMRDGSHLCADVFRPVGDVEQPAIVRLSVYGKAFGIGSICSAEDAEQRERDEDRWFEDKPKGLPLVTRYAENAVSANAFDWVPRGYVLVRVDPRGVGHSPGSVEPFSRQEAEDYFDAIEWAAQQPWCDGKVGTFGASYAATNQWNVAALQPPSLAAMIPFASDTDAYRELAYPGGILQEGYRSSWWAMVRSLQCPNATPTDDFVERLRSHPFDDPSFYGPNGDGVLGADFDKVAIPFLTAVSQTGILHGRAGFEAFARSPAADKQLIVVDSNYPSFLYRECLADEIAFFDRHLKGRADVASPPPVLIMVRLGDSQYEWRAEHEWPAPGTEHRRWHLDLSGATPALSGEAAAGESIAEYAADDVTGLSFTSPPLDADVDLIGHVNATLWVSSTSPDADLYLSLRVLDPDEAEVSYAIRDRTFVGGITWGCLKVSQRAADPGRSDHRPWHTHLAGDRSPLRGEDDVVEVTVELLPTAVRIPAGHRLRLDVQPLEGPGGYIDAMGVARPRAVDASYHADARNRLHSGGSRCSSIELPIVQRRAPFEHDHRESRM